MPVRGTVVEDNGRAEDRPIEPTRSYQLFCLPFGLVVSCGCASRHTKRGHLYPARCSRASTNFYCIPDTLNMYRLKRDALVGKLAQQTGQIDDGVQTSRYGSAHFRGVSNIANESWDSGVF